MRPLASELAARHPSRLDGLVQILRALARMTIIQGHWREFPGYKVEYIGRDIVGSRRTPERPSCSGVKEVRVRLWEILQTPGASEV